MTVLHGAAPTPPGVVYGSAGGSLRAGFAGMNVQAASAGVRGEQATARVLNGLAGRAGGPTVLHDLDVPLPGFTANIDHAVVSGRRVVLVDSKVWRPGFYWTAAGVTRRGMARFAPADKGTLPVAARAVQRLLERRRTGGRVGGSLMVVWPSHPGRVRLWLFRPQEARAVAGRLLERRAVSLVGCRPADPRVVQALLPLLKGSC